MAVATKLPTYLEHLEDRLLSYEQELKKVSAERDHLATQLATMLADRLEAIRADRRRLPLVEPDDSDDDRILRRGPVTLDLEEWTVRYLGREARLSRREVEVLRYFFVRGCRWINSSYASEDFGYKPTRSGNTWRMAVNRLRRRMRAVGLHDLIENGGSCGIGYRLNPAVVGDGLVS